MLKSMLTHMRETRMREFEGEEAADAGFTLIELMVVLLIIAILLAIAIPTFLGVTNTAGDRAAQSNLTNALTEAKALYQVDQAYSSGGVAYVAASFASQAPEFGWTAASCSAGGAPNNCISFAVGDVNVASDGQGVVLASWSAKTDTCWYAIDLENTPASISGDAKAFIGQAVDANTTATLPTAGVFYGKTTGTGTVCQGSVGLDPQTNAGWATSYSNAKTVA
jgi:type IV pilus assembly protein PilA